MKPILSIKNLTVSFNNEEGRIKAINDISLDLNHGEVIGLVGESGSGKSLIAKTIMRLNPNNSLIHPKSKIILNHNNIEHNVLKLKKKHLKIVRGGAVSMIFQEPMASFAPAISVGNQIIETMQIHLRKSYKECRKIGIELFEKVGISEPDIRFDQYVFELSGGMRQRAMIAMALSTNPKILIADEPTTALDVTIQKQVLNLMLELREQYGMAMIFITHDFGVVSQIADNVAVLRKGEVIENNPTKDILYSPTHKYTKKLLNAIPKLDKLPKIREENSTPIVEVNKLNVNFPINLGIRSKKNSFHAVKDVCITLIKGNITGLVGESGSGKTTLGKALLAAAPISSGKINFFTKENISFSDPDKIDRRTFAKVGQMIFQDPYASLNPRMTVRDIIAEPLEISNMFKKKEDIDNMVKNIAKLCQIDITHLRRFPHAFSGGQRQRISIARALITNPEFIVADESVAALDTSTQLEILKLLKSLCKEIKITFLFISHDLSVIANFCDQVIVMRKGEIIEKGPTKDIFLNPKEKYTKKLISSIPSI